MSYRLLTVNTYSSDFFFNHLNISLVRGALKNTAFINYFGSLIRKRRLLARLPLRMKSNTLITPIQNPQKFNPVLNPKPAKNCTRFLTRNPKSAKIFIWFLTRNPKPAKNCIRFLTRNPKSAKIVPGF